jgi:hypothetical protein
MVKKVNKLQVLKEINMVVKNMPGLKESISFREENEFDDLESEMPNDYDETTKLINSPKISDPGKTIVDQIRKLVLQGMSNLADNSDSESYQTLKKIFSTCDQKIKNNEKTESNS